MLPVPLVDVHAVDESALSVHPAAFYMFPSCLGDDLPDCSEVVIAFARIGVLDEIAFMPMRMA